MQIKEKLKSSFKFNLLIVFTLCTLLYVLFFASLRCITHHGKEVAMPNVRGKSIDSAIIMMQKLGFDVEIDSTFDPTCRPLSIIKQVPDTGSLVKEGRTIFLTVNMRTPPKIAMPNIKDLSYKSAEMILRNHKLVVGDTVYRADIATGAVLEASFNGKIIVGGDLVPQGSKIDLVIGNGLGNTEWDVPSITGLTVDEAIIILNQYNLQPLFNVSENTSITDTFSAIIIDQTPRAYSELGEKNRIKMNDFINLQIKQDPKPDEIYTNNPLPDNNNQ